ncbi:ESX secretion-associated protein EspG [Mycobacterium sp. LTG2003]
MTVRRPAPRHVGSIDLIDLDIICRFHGRESLPYPFMLTKPTNFASHDEYTAYGRSVSDRFDHGDLQKFRRWAAAYAYADIRVECHVQYISADTPSLRVLGHRVGELGFVARQRENEDILDVYEVSPYDLGQVVADAVDVGRPGKHTAVAFSEPSTVSRTAPHSEDFRVHHEADRSPPTVIRRAAVTAFGSVQSHWRPTRRWGLDRGKNAAVWVSVEDDGSYLFDPEIGAGRPMTRPALAGRIDELIAEDVAVLRDFKNDTRAGETA